MAIVINDPYARGGGGVAGEQVGHTLSSGLEALAHHKMAQVAQGRTQQVLKSLNFSPEQAHLISMFPQEIQFKILSQMIPEGGQQYQQQPQEALQELQQPMQQQQGQQGIGQLMQQFNQPYQPQNEMQMVQQALGGNNRGLNANEGIYQYLKSKKQDNITPNAQRAANLSNPQFNDSSVQFPQNSTIPRRAPLLQSPQDRRESAKERFEQEQAERPFYQKTLDQYESSRSTLNDVNRLTNLINKGKIVNPTEDHMQRYLSSIFKINLKDLRGADTEEFEKITAGFIKNAKQWFGSRVTNYDLESFMKTLPQLSTSHEGKMRILGSMKAAAQAQQLKYDALRHLMKQNGGRIPPYAQLQVEELIKPELDALSEQFVNGSTAPQLSQEAIEGSNRGWWMRPAKAFITAPGLSRGSGIPGAGALTDLAGKAFKGLAGSIF